ncbi:MAG: hypothetical protein JJE04_05635 [Acidobacteriia bacterium]|nr:hypothetical protein [Terriglobia bacterium]
MIAAYPRAATHAPLDDLEHGHSVIIAARWLLVAAGLMFVLYRPQSTTELTAGVLAVLGIAAANFWLHTRPLTNQPVEPLWAYMASAADLAVISGLVLMQGSLTSKAYVFYYPAVLVYSLVFPARVSAVLTAAVLGFVFTRGIGDGMDERILVARLVTLAATALIGWRYRRVEEQRRERRVEVSSNRAVYESESARIEAQEDIFYGQIVCITARWCIIAGSIFLALFHADDTGAMERSLIPLLILVAANFFLQGRYMMRSPANALLLQLLSFVDLAVITVIVMNGNPEFFVFYYPVALAYAMVFVRRLALIFTGVLAIGYTMVAVLVAPGIHFNGDEETLAIRLVTLLGTTLLGTMYWRLQRTRRPRGV